MKRLRIAIPIFIIGFGVCFLPANLFFWFIVFMSILVMLTGIREIMLLGTRAKEPEWIFYFALLMVLYFMASIIIFFGFASGLETGSNPKGWYLLMLAPAGTYDGISYLTGRTIGKHKIQALKKISPNKTWEGTFYGFLASFDAGILILAFAFSLEFYQIILTSLIISTCSVFGDLAVSKFKRIMQVKDSGTILRGHGGILDRLSSQLLANYGIYALYVFSFWF